MRNEEGKKNERGKGGYEGRKKGKKGGKRREGSFGGEERDKRYGKSG